MPEATQPAPILTTDPEAVAAAQRHAAQAQALAARCPNPKAAQFHARMAAAFKRVQQAAR